MVVEAVKPFEDYIPSDEQLLADIDTELTSLQRRLEFLLELKQEVERRRENQLPS
jgi:hypothetical protein